MKFEFYGWSGDAAILNEIKLVFHYQEDESSVCIAILKMGMIPTNLFSFALPELLTIIRQLNSNSSYGLYYFEAGSALANVTINSHVTLSLIYEYTSI